MSINLTPREIYNWILWIALQIVGAGLLLIFVSNIVRHYGGQLPFVPGMEWQALAWACFGWLALRYKGIA
jgi:hypothetical protein